MSAAAAVDIGARLGELARRILIAQESCIASTPREGVAYDEDREHIFRAVSGYHDGLCDAWRVLTGDDVPVNVLGTSVTQQRLVSLLSEGDRTRQELEVVFARNREQIQNLITRSRRAGYRINRRRVRTQVAGKDRSTYYYSLAEDQRLGVTT